MSVATCRFQFSSVVETERNPDVRDDACALWFMRLCQPFRFWFPQSHYERSKAEF
ncbi:hypothetical protein T4E_12344 [Trichinella pseudospiralis]|uniref:Uncharacterized protein n=1 Tax=Trichinella pseudospiralis TaxID=6337 RepID=A0A0V0XJL8_TRIPS|nr:hypothetical protein T4E_12344 [Trichinella pseudospiralis]